MNTFMFCMSNYPGMSKFPVFQLYNVWDAVTIGHNTIQHMAKKVGCGQSMQLIDTVPPLISNVLHAPYCPSNFTHDVPKSVK